MEDIISKELLSEVLKCEGRIQIIHHMCKNQTMVYYDEHISCASFEREINIYELAYKCKEWAFKQGYYLDSGFCKNGGRCFTTTKENWGMYTEKTEIEAIFKACQYILDNKDSRD